jgi:hypothetical protein
MLPLTVTLQVPYAENEQQFLLHAVEAAVRTFRGLNEILAGQEEPTPSYSPLLRIANTPLPEQANSTPIK